ncbi:rRNA methyltransferase 2, mitochondrial [Dermacentor silvarum]|uniref:rRNA methyltransferase 2, mitochondrial n=1 Tax=Dermacentor silvarum TaxID=543639 RepID=UPI00189AD96E|nr:rRNA methyltransferase 2, mitochondrial [Dermacentor silvarum]XP_037558128.1 rRNA methyltransferase 2, mitochondrial [Dermacentor silvarum]
MEALMRFPRLHASQSLRRMIHSSAAQLKLQPQNLKGKSKASQDWLTRHLNDPYVKQSRYDNYRARSAYKLVEIDDKYRILKPGCTVVECGAAPGAWTQVIVERINANGADHTTTRGTVIGLDLLPIDPVPGATFLPNTDILKPESTTKVLQCLSGKSADVVLSDLAPNASGVKSLDHEGIVALTYAALILSFKVLSVRGSFLCKIWNGSEAAKLSDDIRRFFQFVHYVKPPASRKESAEIYILGREFKGVEK